MEKSRITTDRSNSLISVRSLPKSPVIEKINPIRIPLKKELKIPINRKTPIYTNTGFHLERDLSSANNYQYFSKLVENVSENPNQRSANIKSAYTHSTQKKVKVASSNTSAPVSKPIKSVTITNRSRSKIIQNIDTLIRKSEMSYKTGDSRLDNQSNLDCISVSDESIQANDFEENVILNIIAKAKCGETMNEEQIENSLTKKLIVLKHRATPFDSRFLNPLQSANQTPVPSQTPLPTELQEIPQKMTFEHETPIHTELTFLDRMKRTYLEDLERFRNYNVSQYYFTNMNDFKKKLFKSTDKVLISESSAPDNSNELYNRIEKFNVAECYKKKNFQENPEIKRVLTGIKNLEKTIKDQESVPASFSYFKSMKKFRLAPEDGPVSKMNPPLMRNRNPKKDQMYNRYKYLSNNMINNNNKSIRIVA